MCKFNYHVLYALLQINQNTSILKSVIVTMEIHGHNTQSVLGCVRPAVATCVTCTEKPLH